MWASRQLLGLPLACSDICLHFESHFMVRHVVARCMVQELLGRHREHSSVPRQYFFEVPCRAAAFLPL